MKIFFKLSVLLLLNISCAHKSDKGPASDQARPGQMPAACVDSVCRLRVDGYPNEVAVFIPPYADFKQVTLFLHGFSFQTDRDRDLNAIINDLKIEESFKASPTNRILIMPFSKGKNVDFRAYFKGKSELQIFLAALYSNFGMRVMVEDVQLISHSGSYVTVQNLIADKSKVNENLKISEVTLLDATYSDLKTKVFIDWLKSGEHKMTVVYLKSSLTEPKALELWKAFSSENPGKHGGFNLEDGHFLSVIPEVEVRKLPGAHWLLARKWFGRAL